MEVFENRARRSWPTRSSRSPRTSRSSSCRRCSQASVRRRRRRSRRRGASPGLRPEASCCAACRSGRRGCRERSNGARRVRRSQSQGIAFGCSTPHGPGPQHRSQRPRPCPRRPLPRAGVHPASGAAGDESSTRTTPSAQRGRRLRPRPRGAWMETPDKAPRRGVFSSIRRRGPIPEAPLSESSVSSSARG